MFSFSQYLLFSSLPQSKELTNTLKKLFGLRRNKKDCGVLSLKKCKMKSPEEKHISAFCFQVI